MNEFTRYRAGMMLFLLLACGTAWASLSEEEAKLAELKAMSMEELGEVVVQLDDVFDVFDGLIKNRKVKVATGETQDAAKAPSVTSVITAQDIEAMGARDLDEVLESVPGLHVAYDPIQYRPIYTIRGIYSEFNPEVLMLVNGIPLTSLYIGDRGFTWQGMPVQAIARIEVIRGPGSAVFGADAFSGVVNIITKSKEDIDGLETGARVGSYNSRDVWTAYGGSLGKMDIALNLEYTTTDGHNGIVEADAQTAFDQLFGTHASYAPGSVNVGHDQIEARLDASWDKWRLRTGYQGRRNGGGGVGVAAALDPHVRHGADRINADLTWNDPHFTRYWDVTAQASVLNSSFFIEKDQYIFPPGAFGGTYPNGFIGNPEGFERHSRLDLSGFYSGFDKHLLRIGSGYYYGEMYNINHTSNFGVNPETGLAFSPGIDLVDLTDTPSAYLPEEDRKSWYGYLQDIWSINKNWELTAGVRYDRYSDFGKTVNPRAALVWQAHDNLTAKVLYGSAFRAPGFQQLYTKNNPVTIGNPDLKPETIDTWELAADYMAANNLHFSGNLYSYKTKDKILFLPDPGGATNTAQNAGLQKGYGGELEMRWKPNVRTSLLLNYAYQNSTDELNGYDVGGAPTHQVYLRGDWLMMPNWFLDVQFNWVINRKRSFGDPRMERVDDYTKVDLTLRYKDIKDKRWNVAVGVRNLFDTDAREPSLGPNSSGILEIPYDLPLPGRNFFVEVRYSFK